MARSAPSAISPSAASSSVSRSFSVIWVLQLSAGWWIPVVTGPGQTGFHYQTGCRRQHQKGCNLSHHEVLSFYVRYTSCQSVLLVVCVCLLLQTWIVALSVGKSGRNSDVSIFYTAST